MKRFRILAVLLAAFLLFGPAATAWAVCTNTATLVLCKPARGDLSWDTNLNSNFDLIEAALGTAASPTFTGLVAASTTFALINTVATTVNFAGAATTLAIGAASAAVNFAGGPVISGGTAANNDITIQGTTSATRTTSYVLLQPNGGLVGIGGTPTETLHIINNQNEPTCMVLDNQNAGNAAVAGISTRVGATVHYDTALNSVGAGTAQSGFTYPLGGRLFTNTSMTGGLSIATRSSTAGADMRFYTGGIADANERMRILSTGNVGINTVTPGGSVTAGTGVQSLGNGTAPVGGVANQVSMYSADRAGTGGKASLHVMDETGQISVLGDMWGLNETSNANMTIGLTINQGAADDSILALKSSDVAHGRTTLTETDTYTAFSKGSATGGGLKIMGISDTEATTGNYSLQLLGYTADAALDTTKTTAGLGAVVIAAGISDGGTAIAIPGADENLMVIQAFTTTRFIFDQEGSGHADVAWSAFDTHDDVMLLASLEREMRPPSSRDPMSRDIGESLKYDILDLEAAGIIGKGSRHEENGRPRAMVNMTRLAMLQTGAIRQVYAEVKRSGQELQKALARIAYLESLLDSTNGRRELAAIQAAP